MDFKDWEPFYEKILEDLSISREDDLRAAALLNSLLKEPTSLKKLKKEIKDKAAIFGNAPCLESDVEKGIPKNTTLISADGATSTLLENRIIPDIVVTDLDGGIECLKSASNLGSFLIIHAHGDNIKLLKNMLPELYNYDKKIIGTTQTKPVGKLHNFGGFTDGDRAVFMAEELGAKEIKLYGFDFKAASRYKRKKLCWAKELLNISELNNIDIHKV